MEDMNVASINRMNLTQVTYLKVDMALEVYLLSILRRIVDTRDKTDLFATLHTVIEIAIQAGIDAERRRMQDAIAAATVDEGEMTDSIAALSQPPVVD
jgi:hypothetical protein